MSKTIKVTDKTFEDTITNASTPVLVDFWAEWCGPCKMIAPALDELASELDGKLLISKLNVDENPDTAQAFGVMSIPTLLVFKDGQPVERIVGAHPKAQLKARLEKVIGSDSDKNKAK